MFQALGKGDREFGVKCHTVSSKNRKRKRMLSERTDTRIDDSQLKRASGRPNARMIHAWCTAASADHLI